MIEINYNGLVTTISRSTAIEEYCSSPTLHAGKLRLLSFTFITAEREILYLLSLIFSANAHPFCSAGYITQKLLNINTSVHVYSVSMGVTRPVPVPTGIVSWMAIDEHPNTTSVAQLLLNIAKPMISVVSSIVLPKFKLVKLILLPLNVTLPL